MPFPSLRFSPQIEFVQKYPNTGLMFSVGTKPRMRPSTDSRRPVTEQRLPKWISFGSVRAAFFDLTVVMRMRKFPVFSPKMLTQCGMRRIPSISAEHNCDVYIYNLFVCTVHSAISGPSLFPHTDSTIKPHIPPLSHRTVSAAATRFFRASSAAFPTQAPFSSHIYYALRCTANLWK